MEDRASDEKMQKVIARNMIVMVGEINAQFSDGKQHVTCYTCHRGSTMPATKRRAKLYERRRETALSKVQSGRQRIPGAPGGSPAAG